MDSKYIGYPEGFSQLVSEIELPDNFKTKEERENFCWMQLTLLIHY